MREERIEIEGVENRKIKGLIFYPEIENPPAIVMVHGYDGEGLTDYWLKTAEDICREGFAVLTFLFSAYNSLPDIRDLSIMDEMKELKLIIDFFEKQDIDKERIGLFAQSLGSSVTLLLNDSRIKAYVLLALNPKLKELFSNYLFNEEIIEELEKHGFFKRRITSTGETRTIGVKIWDEVDEIKEISEEKIKEIKKPVLLIWGTKDNYTSISEAKNFYEMFNEPKKLVFIEDSPHATIHDDHRDETLKEAIDWFKKYLK